MKKMLRRLAAFILIIGTFCVNGLSLVGYACLYPPSEDGKDAAQLSEDNDIRYWHQGVIPPDNSPITPGNSSIGSAACSSFAMTYCLVKMGIYHTDEGDDPIKLINEGRDKGLYSNGWYFDYCNIGKLYPDIKCINDFDSGPAGLSSKDVVDYVKGLMAEGKYVIVCVNGPQGGHMIFFDGVTEDGKVSIGDSAFAGLDWETTYGAMNATVQYAVIFEYTEKSTDRPSIYDEVALRKDKKADKKDIETKDKIVEEYDLNGMPAKYTLQDVLKVPHCYGRDDFNENELAVLREIKETKDLSKKSLGEIVRIVIVVLGILLMIYSILLILVYWVDEFSPLHLSLLGVLSAGSIKLLHDGDDISLLDTELQRKYMKPKKLFIIAIVIFIMGCTLVSGKAYSFVYWLILEKLGVSLW